MTEPIRLHMNEMPYPPPAHVLKAAQRGLALMHRYTDPEPAEALRGLLAGYCGVPREHLVLSPGSDLLLREVIHSFSQGRKVITVSPSFFPTVQAARQFAPDSISIRLSPPAFCLDLELLLDTLERPSLVIIDNPNNPTGAMLLNPQAVTAILEREEALLVVDEAYYEFSGQTFAAMVPDHARLMVIRTLDKAFSLAGTRVGYGIAGAAFLDALSWFGAFPPQASLHAAVAALGQPGYVRQNVRRVIEERERLRQALAALGVLAYLSHTNFLLVRTEVADLAARLSETGVLVSDVSNQLPAGFLRVTTGTPPENDAFIDALAQQISGQSPLAT
ncbi:MAG: pyridoxal phosphate-dependent aminotransferase [Anaerolineae bacterium]